MLRHLLYVGIRIGDRQDITVIITAKYSKFILMKNITDTIMNMPQVSSNRYLKRLRLDIVALTNSSTGGVNELVDLLDIASLLCVIKESMSLSIPISVSGFGIS